MESPRVSLREDQKRMTRDKLIAAARECFEMQGYAKTSVEDITARVGASRATFYLHFKGKPEVLAEIFTQSHIRRVLDLVESLDAMLEPLSMTGIEKWLESYRIIYRDTRGVIRAFIQGESREGSELHPVSDAVRNSFLDVMSRKVVAIRRRQGLSADSADARIRALLMFTELERFCFYVYLRGQPFNIGLGMKMIAEEWYRKLSVE
jgi:AcrR family transcriptional regulator